MEKMFLIGRFIFGGYFIMNGLNHFISRGMMAQFAAAKGVPMAEVAVPLSGLLILLGGLSILLGWQPDLGIGAIVLFLVCVSPIMHNFWAEAGAERMADFVNFTKNVALAGGTLMLAGVPRPWPYSVEATPIRV
jgi:putative oxidoreductase